MLLVEHLVKLKLCVDFPPKMNIPFMEIDINDAWLATLMRGGVLNIEMLDNVTPNYTERRKGRRLGYNYQQSIGDPLNCSPYCRLPMMRPSFQAG